jgi:alkanesulfonate monooxygenase SsuD/methylene tetrahydromethanopterin reductase-like flavin-dependent oxidoreductase (luciferase family)
MKVGIGLPNTVPGTEGKTLVEWARRADASGFSSLGVIDRLVYPNYDPIVSLAAAAAVTERIGLMTTVLLGPLRPNAVSLAKEALSLDCLSGGRFSLGIALGARSDDYEVSGIPWEGRGAALERQLEQIKKVWGGEVKGMEGRPVGPPPVREGRPELIVGGHGDAAIERAARFGDGWIMGGGAPDQFRELGAKFDQAWGRAGRAGKPRKVGLAYFALGPDGKKNADSYIHDYYGWLGEVADMIASSVATDEETVRAYLQAFSDAGCEELVFFACSADVEQVELLAGARP